MKSNTYYNELDAYPAQWLRNLCAAGHLPDGDVDERDIKTITDYEKLKGYQQCHFFAGIGVWAYAIKEAGFPSDIRVWTGSCPCQPFSYAGKRKGTADDRHLWPDWFRLIRECRPDVIFGEQVASAVGPSQQNAGVQEMLDREAVFRVLRELQGASPELVQGLRPKIGTDSEEKKSTVDEFEIQTMEGRKARSCACECSEAPSQSEGASVQLGPNRNSIADKRRPVRNDRHSIRSDNAESMERSLFGPDHTWEGVHEGECPCCPVCGERHGEYLGNPANCGYCECDIAETPGSLSRVIESIRGKDQEYHRFPWFDIVQADLESCGYTVRAIIAPAAGYGAPHIRQRLYFVAVAKGKFGHGTMRTRRRWNGSSNGGTNGTVEHAGREQRSRNERAGRETIDRPELASGTHQLGESTSERRGEEGHEHSRRPSQRAGDASQPHVMGDAEQPGLEGRRLQRMPRNGESRSERALGSPSYVNGFWSDAEWLACTDGKARAAKPGTLPLALRTSGDVGRLRAYGNSLVAPQAIDFVRAAMEELNISPASASAI